MANIQDFFEIYAPKARDSATEGGAGVAYTSRGSSFEGPKQAN